MADESISGTGFGDVEVPFAADLVGTDYLLRIKLDGGSDGVSTPIVAGQGAAVNSLPVVLASDDLMSAAIQRLEQVEDTPHASGDSGFMALAVRNDAGAVQAGTTGDYIALTTDSTGALRVTGSGGTSMTDGATYTRDSSTLTPIGGIAETSAPTLTNGDIGALSLTTGGALRVSQVNGIAGIVDDAAFTPATSEVLPIGMFADETATDSVTEGDIGCPRITLDRKQITTPYVHAAAGGHTPYKNLDVDESEDDIKTSAGKLFWLHVMNLSASLRYLKIYDNVAASVTVGTTVPTLTFPIPTLATTNGAGFTIHFGDGGCQFTTGICIAATTGLADNNSGAPGANEIVLNAGYI